MHGRRHRGIAGLVAATLTVIPVVPAHAAAPVDAEARAPAAVVGLDSENIPAGARLTKALRKAFAARGMSGGNEANLSELRLALGCRSDAPACLAKGGEMLGARRLIYGSLNNKGKGAWELDLWIVRADPASVDEHQTIPLSSADLTPGQIDETAARVVEQLMPEEVTPVPTPEPIVAAPLQTAEDTAQDDEFRSREPPSDKEYLWGPYRPRPKWKWAGFGVSVGVLAVGMAGWIGTSVFLTADNIGFRKRLLEEAEASLTDDKEINDVSPMLPEGVNLCDYAAARPTDSEGNPLGEPGQVRNARVVQVCDDGNMIRRIGTGFFLTAGVGLVSTLVFTTLLFVRRNPDKVLVKAARSRLQLGLSPSRGRGATLRLSGRF